MRIVTIAAAAALLIGTASVGAAEDKADILIRGATVIDGSGAPRQVEDVAVKGQRIVAVGKNLKLSAGQTIDAKGLVLAPGFIDLHNHSEQAIATPTNHLNEGFIRQGVTTIVGGPDGTRSPKEIRDLTAKYQIGIGTNAAFYVGHNAIRLEVMGDNQHRAPTPEEMARMKQLVRDGMKLGAIGFSSGLMYWPGINATTDEMVELAKEAKPLGGMYDTHVRDPGTELIKSNAEAIEIGRRAGIPVKLTHLTNPGSKHHGLMQEAVKQIEDARAGGLLVVSDQYPYNAVGTELLFGALSWDPAMHLDTVDARIAALKDPEKLAKIRKDTLEGPEKGTSIYKVGNGADNFEVLVCPGCRQYEGKFISQIADEMHLDPFDTIVTLLEKYHELPITISLGGFSEEDVRYLMPKPWNMIASDGTALGSKANGAFGVPHPRFTGTYPRVLGHYVRDLKLLTLEDAVRKMTSMPADFAGFADRGRIAVGQYADLALFDPKTIIDNSTWEHPLVLPTGMVDVFVNGMAVLFDGKMTGAAPGMFVRKEKPTPTDPNWPGPPPKHS